jgi:hypothetical protein
MTNTQLKALLHTLKSYHNHLLVKDDAVKIEAWQENGFHFVAISHIELYNERITHTYCYNEIHNTYDLSMVD